MRIAAWVCTSLMLGGGLGFGLSGCDSAGDGAVTTNPPTTTTPEGGAGTGAGAGGEVGGAGGAGGVGGGAGGGGGTASPSGCEAEPLRTTGPVYYVCNCDEGAEAGCVDGDDAADGASAATPWQSWSRAMSTFNTMPAGGTVALCRGGAWTGLGEADHLNIDNANCGLDSPTRAPQAGDLATCDFRDYPSTWGGTSKPLVQFDSGEIFSFGYYEDWLAMFRGFRILNLDLVGGSGAPVGVFAHGNLDGVEICSNDFRDGLGAAWSGQTTLTIFRVNFHHNRVTNNPTGIGALQGISCFTDCYWDNNYFDNNGGNANRDHTIYGGGSPYGGDDWPTVINGVPVGPKAEMPCQGYGSGAACYVPARNTRIRNNEIHNSSTGGTGVCGGAVLIAHGAHEDLLIENNLIIQEPGTTSESCYGIDLTSGLDMPAYMKRTVIRGNHVYGVAGNTIRMNGCQDCVIENNVVYVAGQGSTGIWFPDNGNYCDDVAFPPTDSYTCSGQLSDSAGIIRNNTLYSENPLDHGIYNGEAGSGDGWTIANNVLCGPGVAIDDAAGTTTVGNQLSSTLDGCASWFVLSPTGDPAANNFTPAAGSPLLNAADPATAAPLGLPGAQAGAVPWSASTEEVERSSHDAQPDVGAYER